MDLIVTLHDRALAHWNPSLPLADELPPLAPVADSRDMGELVAAGHDANRTIWALEDEARRRDVGDSRIAAVKRAIDTWNQRRSDLVEAIDVAFLERFANVAGEDVELHSETPGLMIDRLSILALKIANMRHLAADAAGEHDSALEFECNARAALLVEQREDLAKCLARLLDDCAAGRRRFKRYRQMKTYNDERLNPALRRAARAADRA